LPALDAAADDDRQFTAAPEEPFVPLGPPAPPGLPETPAPAPAPAPSAEGGDDGSGGAPPNWAAWYYHRSLGYSGPPPDSVLEAEEDLRFFASTPMSPPDYSEQPGMFSGYDYSTTNVAAYFDQRSSPEEVASTIKDKPQGMFPFGVYGLYGETSLQEGRVYDLRGARTAAFLPDVVAHCIESGHYVRVESVTSTSFTFRTGPSHFDGANAFITFTALPGNLGVDLNHRGYAPNASVLNSILAPIGAPGVVWPNMAKNVGESIPDRTPIHPGPRIWNVTTP
ncbi:MAG: hypothetical protein AAF492_29590, partial [Verrucomicrobiota bacterium]